jgi:membrane protein DedA with SNARE-associated domain/membrane-associated phospholipid phosphatase
VLDNLIHLISLIGPWNYLVIFVILVLECQALIGLFMPGESLVLAAGFLTEQGIFDPIVLIPVIATASILGDSIGYGLGRYLGLGWLIQHGRRFGLRREHLDRVDGFFARHGGKVAFVSHFTHLMRSLTPFVAGASRMSYRQFLVFNAVGCIVWATAFVMLGYFVGASWRVAAKWIGHASEIIGGAILFAIALGWLWRWLVRHEADVKRCWQSVAEHPRVAAMRSRVAPQLDFLRDRLSPRSYMGLQLTIGLLFLIAASWLFGGIAEDVMHGDPLTVIDRDIAEWLHERTTPGMLTVMQFVTDLASPAWVAGAASLTALVLLWKRYWYRLLTFALVVPGGMVLASLLKMVFHRSRPGFADTIMNFQGYSFPSGHTMAATLLYGIFAVFGVMALDSWRWRVRIIIGACVIVLLVSFSRMYLSAHYLSDVLGAISAGLAWLALCLIAVHTFRCSRAHQGRRE